MKKVKRFFLLHHAVTNWTNNICTNFLDNTNVELTKYNENEDGVIIPETVMDSISSTQNYITKTIWK